jgi:zinc resistance-associated protein
MWKTVLAGAAAIMVVGSTLVFAQQRADTDGRQHEQHWRPSQADLNAFTDARIAALRAGLQLTPDQEKNWPGVDQAIRDMAKARQERAAERRREHQQQHPVDLIQRLRNRADAMTSNAANLKKLAEAAQPLYESLTDDQKHRLVFLAHGLRFGHRHSGGWREHHSSEDAPK